MANDFPALRKLAFIASRRSMAEMEVILDRFLQARRAELDEAACERLLILLQRADADLYDWLSGISEPSPGVDREALSWLDDFRRAAPPP